MVGVCMQSGVCAAVDSTYPTGMHFCYSSFLL